MRAGERVQRARRERTYGWRSARGRRGARGGGRGVSVHAEASVGGEESAERRERESNCYSGKRASSTPILRRPN